MKREEFLRKTRLYQALQARGAQQRAQLEEQLSTLSRQSAENQLRLDSVLNELEQERALERTGELNPILMTLASERVIFLDEQRDSLLEERKKLDGDTAEVDRKIMVNNRRRDGLEQRLCDVSAGRTAALSFAESVAIDELSRLGFRGENR